MGDFKIYVNNQWLDFLHLIEHHKKIDVNGTQIKVTSIEDQLKIYKILGREKDLDKINQLQEKFKKP
jgi:hypothetical protein